MREPEAEPFDTGSGLEGMVLEGDRGHWGGPRCGAVVQWMRSVLGRENGTMMRAATVDSRHQIDSMAAAFPSYDSKETVTEMSSPYEMKSERGMAMCRGAM